MVAIYLTNSKGRDSQVMAESVRAPLRVRWLDAEGRQTANCRVLKSTVERDLDALVARHGSLEQVAQALVAGDPEIDFERVGTALRDTARVYIDKERKIVHRAQAFEIVRNPDGTERARRPRALQLPNVTADNPLRWSGKLLPKKDVFNKFVMVAKLQIVHINGLTYDFLYEMAAELEKKNSLALVGAGPKANQPIILRRGGSPYRGFLEGRTRGDKYCLLLHLSNLELKAPTMLTGSPGTSETAVAKAAEASS
jgi:hypothetical protein